jgi:hypothetical protein
VVVVGTSGSKVERCALLTADASQKGGENSAREPTPPGPVLALVGELELPGDSLRLVAPCGGLSTPSVAIAARVAELLPEHRYLNGQTGPLVRLRNHGRCVLGGFHARTVAGYWVEAMAVRLDIAAQLGRVDRERAIFPSRR